MQQITKNQIKFISKIKNNPTFRKKENKVFIQGTHNVKEIILNRPNILELVLQSESSESFDFLQNVKSKTYTINRIQAKKLSFNKKPFNLAAIVNLGNFEQDKKLDYSSGVYIGLCNVQDPFNLGTIFRTAEAFGITGILLFDSSVNPFNQKVVISSTGSVFRVPFIVLDSCVEFLHKNKDISVYGTVVPDSCVAGLTRESGQSRQNTPKEGVLIPYTQAKIDSGIILFGNEGKGLEEKVLGLTKQNLYIPIQTESLNLSVSVGIVLSSVQKS